MVGCNALDGSIFSKNLGLAGRIVRGVNAGAKMHRGAGAKVHQWCWQEGPRTGGLLVMHQAGLDDPPAYRNRDGVSDACSD